MLVTELESLALEDKISSVAFLEEVSERDRKMLIKLIKPLEMMRPRCNEEVVYEATVKYWQWRNLFRQLAVVMKEEQRILVVFEAIYCGLTACHYAQTGDHEQLPMYSVELKMVNRLWIGDTEKELSFIGSVILT